MLLWEKVVYVWPVSNPLDYVRFCYLSPSLFDHIIQPHLIFLSMMMVQSRREVDHLTIVGSPGTMHSQTNFDQHYLVKTMTTHDQFNLQLIILVYPGQINLPRLQIFLFIRIIPCMT